MDLIAVNCGDDAINEGDYGVFWGGEDENTQLEYLAKKYKKIPYEFLTGISTRVKRNLIND
jgi:alanine racemase